MRRLIALLTSVRMAFVLISIIALFCILAALVPQQQPPEFYTARYPGLVATLVSVTHFYDFFHSAIFFLLIGFFVVNLASCSVHRLVTRLTLRMPKRFGPDIIHAGILLLIIAGILTLAFRQEAMIYLREGDVQALPGGYTITLASFEILTYPDGRPQDWISRLIVDHNGATEEHAVEVNEPLSLGSVTLYQNTFLESVSVLLERRGATFELEKNEGLETDDGVLIFLGIAPNDSKALFPDDARGMFAYLKNSGQRENLFVRAGERVGVYSIVTFDEYYYTGLQAVSDPAVWLVIIALVVAGAGLALTVIQKLKEKK